MNAEGSLLPAPGTGKEREDAERTRADAAAMDTAYAAESLAACRRGASVYCVLAGIVIVALIPLDHARFGPLAPHVLVLRAVAAAAMAAVLLLLRTGPGSRYPRALGLLPPALAAALMHAVARESGQAASSIIMISVFALLGVALVIPWPAIWTAIACATILGSDAAVAVVAYGTPAGPAALDAVLVLGAASLVATGLTMRLEQTRRHEFAQRWMVRAAHRETRASAERYRSLIDTAPSAIIVLAASGRITEFNREAERVLGWRRAEMIDRLPAALRDQGSGGQAVTAAVRRALGGQPTQGLEVRLRCRSGEERAFVCNVRRLVDDEGQAGDVIVCAQDVSERKRVEEALDETEARLREVIAGSPVVLFALDRDGMLTLVEGRALRRLGVMPEAIVGRTIQDVLGSLPPEAGRSLKYFARALAGDSVTWSGSLGDATFECRLTPMRDPQGAVTGVLGLALDVSERRRAEETRLALERTLLESQRRESLGVLAGGIAHDFNNLLVAVLGNASLARAELPPVEPARERLRMIEVAARRGSDLVRRLLTYAGKGEVDPEPVDVNVLVAEMRDLLRESIPSRVALDLDLGDDLPSVLADPTQVRQVVMNLLMNGAEAIGAAAGEIRVRTALVELDEPALHEIPHGAGASPGPHLCLEVSDSGCGMDAATVARVFDPFFSTKLAGRGLGLATVLGAVRAHRGALAVTSALGRGTIFHVYLPCTSAVVRPEPAAGAVPGAEAYPGPRTVLLVDDEADVRAVTAHMLERLGCSVLQAGDGREGVEVFRAHAQTIDAVLIDLTLPRLSGDRACHEIRSIRPDARVILMSGFNDERGSGRFGEIGLAGFLRKPFSVADLRSMMDRALGEQSRAS